MAFEPLALVVMAIVLGAIIVAAALLDRMPSPVAALTLSFERYAGFWTTTAISAIAVVLLSAGHWLNTKRGTAAGAPPGECARAQHEQ